MTILEIKTTDNNVVEIACENVVTHDILNVLESAKKVNAYKITQNGVKLVKSSLKYHYGSYLKPAGKAIGYEEMFFIS